MEDSKKMSEMRDSTWVTKGSRIRARWLQSHLAALSGMQMKTAVTEKDVTGTVTYVEGVARNKEEQLKKIAYKTVIGLKLDDGSEIEIDSKHIIEVLQ